MTFPAAIAAGLLVAQVVMSQPARTGTGVISGVVTAVDSGQPLPHASVTLTGPLGESRVVATDDEGRFLFDGLAPARYRLGARPGSFRTHYLTGSYGARRAGEQGTPIVLANGERFTAANIALERGAIIQGRVLTAGGEPMSGVAVQARPPGYGRPQASGRSRDVTDDEGRFRLFGLMPGQVVLAATPPDLAGATTEGTAERLLPTYYPSSVTIDDAERLRLETGAELRDLVLRIRQSRTFTVAGTVVESSGAPASWLRIGLMPLEPGLPGAIVTSQGDDSFTIRDVLPGRYRIVARTGPVDAPQPEHGPSGLEFGDTELTVTRNTEGIRIVTAPGIVIPGRVVYAEAPPAGAAARIQILATPHRHPRNIHAGSSAAVSDDLRFTLRDLFGQVLVRVGGAPPGHALRAITLGGQEVADEPLNAPLAAGRSLEIVLTSRVTRVDGLLLDTDGAPATQGVVVLVPDMPAQRALLSWRLRIAVVTGDGRIRIEDALPGTYRALAVRSGELDLGSESSARWLESVLPSAVPLTLEPGRTETITLRLRDP